MGESQERPLRHGHVGRGVEDEGWAGNAYAALLLEQRPALVAICKQNEFEPTRQDQTASMDQGGELNVSNNTELSQCPSIRSTHYIKKITHCLQKPSSNSASSPCTIVSSNFCIGVSVGCDT